MIFINDSPPHTQPADSHHSSMMSSPVSESNERKRKGSSMENVISKLSRRQHRYTIKPSAEPMSHYSSGSGEKTTSIIA